MNFVFVDRVRIGFGSGSKHHCNFATIHPTFLMFPFPFLNLASFLTLPNFQILTYFPFD